MAEAKLGKRRSPATRRLMAQAHLGSGHLGEEARAEVGDRFRGQPKTPEHRLKLAAVARRRHAATRVLRAVEAVYSAAGASNPGSSGGTGGVAPANSMGGNMGGGGNGSVSAPSSGSSTGGGGSAGGNMGAVRASAYSMGLTGLSAGSGKRLSRTQILNTFKSELREYRLLQVGAGCWLAGWLCVHLGVHGGWCCWICAVAAARERRPVGVQQFNPPACLHIEHCFPLRSLCLPLPLSVCPWRRRSCPPGPPPLLRSTTASPAWWMCSARASPGSSSASSSTLYCGTGCSQTPRCCAASCRSQSQVGAGADGWAVQCIVCLCVGLGGWLKQNPLCCTWGWGWNDLPAP